MIKENELTLCRCDEAEDCRRSNPANKGLLNSWIATLTTFARNDRKQAAFTLAEVPEARQHGSKRAAFTLAEILITLGIIGVVAAMTIPTLIQKHEEKVTVVKVKKMYSTLSQAYLMNLAQDENPMPDSSLENINIEARTKKLAQVFLPYLKVAKDCGIAGSGDTDCVYNGTYKFRNGNDYFQPSSQGYKYYSFLLQDGSSVFLSHTVSERDTNRNITRMSNIINYDVNGFNPPNTFGVDTFGFVIINDRVEPVGYDSFSSDCLKSKDVSKGVDCTAWLIKNGNMDYLHCDDLSWDGKHKCSD